jgi:hypothetical protein
MVRRKGHRREDGVKEKVVMERSVIKELTQMSNLSSTNTNKVELQLKCIEMNLIPFVQETI